MFARKKMSKNMIVNLLQPNNPIDIWTIGLVNSPDWWSGIVLNGYQLSSPEGLKVRGNFFIESYYLKKYDQIHE